VHDYLAAMEQKYDEGKLEGKIEIARKLKKNGAPLSLIALVSGLSEKEISSL
jgi:hypothetical protein